VSAPPRNFAAWLLEAGDADQPALIHGSNIVTYAALRERVRSIAGFVQAQHGGPERAIVPLVGETSIDLVSAYLGVLYAGAIPAPLGPVSEDVLRSVVVETKARMTLVAGEQPARSASDGVIACADAVGAPAQAVPVGPDDVAALMYTSGSTGRSRGVIVSSRNLWSNTRAIMEAVPLTARDRALVTLPLYYCYGASVVHTHLRAGATVVIATDTYAVELIAALSDTRASALPAVPSLIQMLVARGALANASLPDLRWIMVSGGRLAERTVRELRAALPGVRIYIRYGVTELTAAASILSHDRLHDKLGSIGSGIPGTPLRVERPDGSEVAPGSGEVGEIVGRGDHVTLGYFDDAEETARAFRAGAFHTGDLATVDADGFVTVVGREKEFIKTGGHRVAPQEIDGVLMRHPAVQSAAACGISHPLRGEALVAAVVVRDGATVTPAQLRRHCAEHLPPYKVPTRFHVLAELPRTRNGKHDRRALAAMLESKTDD
jgi:acyl-CoA synthetase (AMP-forming)/AMP-acid ligase II